MSRPQRSVSREGSVTGVGLHSGVRVTLRVRPARAGAGIVFVRSDLPGRPRIPADVAHLGERERRTALLGARGVEVHTVEHFLACCLALGVDNLEVWLDGPECPGMDGSAAEFASLLASLGPVDQGAPRPEITVAQPVAVAAGEDAALVAMPSREGLTVSYTLDYAHPGIGRQHYALRVTPESFREEIAPARTFCLASEADALRAQGLGKGATYENTLVVGDDGVVQNTVRWPDEFVRHKILDLLGDLSLAGGDLRAHVHAYRTGHQANLLLVRAIRQHAAEPAPASAPALSLPQIRRILPHRYPFLLVDRVLELEGFQRAVGVKNVSINEPYFQGHYPQEPIMPGVLVVEAMAQLAGILLLRKLELTGRVPVLLSIDRVKFRRAVLPGDQLRLEAQTLRIAASRGRVQCRASVEGQRVAEARLNFALTDASSA